MDRSWITTSKLGTPEYNAGVMEFIRFALENNSEKREKLPCPCYMCHNLMHHKVDVILHHLNKWEFDRTYTCWHRHGERKNVFQSSDHESNHTNEGLNLEDMVSEYEKIIDDEPQVIGELLSDSEKPLYNGCIKYSKLSALLKLYNLKVGHGWTDQSFTALLELLTDVLPSENLLPSSTYEAKKVLCTMGLRYEKIHACSNDCILFRNEFENLQSCPKCNASRYKKKRNVPAKVLWYFPIIPRFERMYSDPMDAEMLTWHKFGRKKDDGLLRHPADSPQWRFIDSMFSDFGKEERNLRLGLSTDGEIVVTGRNDDILGRALKTPEHGGCVRGVGSGVTNKQYFGYNKPTPRSQLESELCTVKSQLANVINNQKLMASYFISGQSNPEQMQQFTLALTDHGLLNGDFGNFNSTDNERPRSIDSQIAPIIKIANQGLQGVNFQLSQHSTGAKSGSNSASKRVSNNGVSEGANGESFRIQEKEVQAETYRVPWPEPEQAFGPEYELQKEHVNIRPFPKGVESLCSLAIENENWVDIVALGKVYIPMEGEVVKHHFKLVPNGYYRVSVTHEINSSAPLPCPEGEMRFICQAKDNFFIWPDHLVFPFEQENSDKANNQSNKEFTATCQRSPSSQSSCNRKYTITHADKLKLTTSLIKIFKDVAIGMKKSGKTRSFTIPFRVFLNEQCVTLDYEDMLDWCFQREIGSSHMSLTMMILSELVHTEGISGLYGFCDCNYLSPLTPTEKNEDDRCDYLSRVFACNDGKNKNQLFFAPYNEGRHWMLAVICPWVGLVHWLDPAGTENEPREFAQTIINRAIIKFSMKHRKDITKIKKNPYIKWKKIECPRQPSATTDCGYYVCRYMIEIIESRQMFIPDKYFDKVPPTYSQEMIDNLREMWISYVTRQSKDDDDDDDDDDLLEL